MEGDQSSPFTIFIYVRTSDQGIKASIKWVDFLKGSNWGIQVIPKGFWDTWPTLV